MTAGTTARRRRSGLGSYTAQPEPPAPLRQWGDRDRTPFRKWSMIAGTNVRRRRSGLGSHTAKPECSASLRHRDDPDRAPFREWPMTAGATARTAGTTARRRRNGPGYYTAQLGCYTSKPDCSVPLRHPDDPDRAPFPKWAIIPGTKGPAPPTRPY